MICFVTTFGEWLEKKLRERGMKKVELAAASRLDSSMITRYASGESFPDVRSLAAIAEGLGVDYDTIMRAALGKPENNSEKELDPATQELLSIAIRLPLEQRIDLRDTGRAKLRRHERDRRTKRDPGTT